MAPANTDRVALGVFFFSAGSCGRDAMTAKSDQDRASQASVSSGVSGLGLLTCNGSKNSLKLTSETSGSLSR